MHAATVRILFFLLLCSGPVIAHGGSFRGPRGSLPAGVSSREQVDEPAAPPPAPESGGSGAEEEDDAEEEPSPRCGVGAAEEDRPEREEGHETGGGATAPTAGSSSSGPTRRAKGASSAGGGAWRIWWAHNRDEIVYRRDPRTGNPMLPMRITQNPQNTRA